MMKKITLHKNILIVFLLVLPTIATGQKAYRLDECISIAQESSPAAKIARSNYTSRMESHQSFIAGYYPQLQLSGSLPGAVRAISPVIQPDGSQLFRPQSQLFSSAELSLNQKIPFTGGEIFISSGLSRIDILESSEMLLWRTTPFEIRLQQPLFQYNYMKWDREIEDLRSESYTREYAEQMAEVAIDVTEKFFNLYIAEMNRKNAAINVANNDTLFKLTEGRYNMGKIAENDLLQSQLALTNDRNSLEIATLEYQQAREELNITLGFDPKTEIAIEPPLDFSLTTIDTDKAYAEAIKNRSDIIQFKLQEKQSEQRIAQAEYSSGFNATISASYGINQSAGDVKSAYRDFLDQERFDIGFSIPIFQWGKGSASIESALADQQRVKESVELQRKNFELETRYQILKFRQLQNQVLTSAKADTIASRRFEVAKNRFLIGKIDLNTYFIAQNEKNTALTSYIQTLKNYWVAFYRIRRLTLYDFAKDEPLYKD